MKKFLSILYVMLLPIVVHAINYYDAMIDGIYYNFSTDGATVTFQTKQDNHIVSNYKDVVIIPEFVTYRGKNYPVISIGDNAFYSCDELVSVSIPNSVMSIGGAAFQYCSSLTSMSIPNSVMSIGKGAFAWCSSLTKVSLPNGVLTIGEGAFYGCSSLASITIPDGVTYIRDNTFWDCSSLTSVTIGNSVSYIGNSAFRECSSLTSVTIGNSLSHIGDAAFCDCNSLSSVRIPNIVKFIGKNAFYGCYFATDSLVNNSSLTSSNNWSATLCESETSDGLLITDGTLIKCRLWATSVTIPNSVTSIGDAAFSNCWGLTSIIIPKSVMSIAKDAFSGCYFVTNSFVNNSSLASSANWSATLCETETSDGLLIKGEKLVKCRPWAVSVTIPNNVTSIESQTFYGCKGLTSVTIGTGILSIGYNAFADTYPKKVIWLTNTPPTGYSNIGKVNYVANDQYTNLSNVSVYPFLSSMFEVDGVAFVPVSPSERTCDAIDCAYNESVENINIGESVTNKGISLTVKQISSYLCYGNPFIKNVNLSFKCDVGNHAFYGCTNLNEATISNKGNIGNYAFSDCTNLNKVTINNQGSIGKYAFSGCSALLSAELRNELTSIGNNAFMNCSMLESIVIPESVESIGNYVFRNCTAMKSVKIGKKVNTIPSYAFTGCSSLKEIQIGNGVTLINTGAFENCSSLPSVQIPQNVTSIEDYVFNGCKSLNTVHMDDGEVELKIGSSGNYPLFAYCPLDSVYIGRNITYPTTNDKGYSPFCNNGKLRSVTITDKETEISAKEFFGCSALRTIELGQKITTIGTEAFSGCKKLNKIVIPDAVKTIGDNAFKGCSSMTSVKIGCGVHIIPAYTFSGCSSLPTIQIPQNVTSIANYVFENCSSLKTVMIDDSDVELALGCNGSNPMFKNCKLDSIYIGRKITYPTTSDKGFSPFYRNTTLRSVTITDKETEISQNEFFGCTNLKNVKIGDGVTTIGDYAFSGCSSLEAFAFGSNVEAIGQEVFSDCTAMASMISNTITPPTCGSQALDDINKWNCTLFVPKGSLTAYKQADQWKEFFFMEENTGIAHVLADDVQIKTENGVIYISGVDNGTNIDVYSINGQTIGSGKAFGNEVSITTGSRKGEITIVRIGDKAVKVVMK